MDMPTSPATSTIMDFMTEEESANPSKAKGDRRRNAWATHSSQPWAFQSLPGASFGPQDTATSPKVAVINQTPGAQALPAWESDREAVQDAARRPRYGFRSWASAPIRAIANLRDDPPPQFFVPYVQQPEVGGLTYAIRTRLSSRRRSCPRCARRCSRLTAICP